MDDAQNPTLLPIPPLNEIKQIPVPAYYRGHNDRLRDYLDGFQSAWELALAYQNDASPPPPNWD